MFQVLSAQARNCRKLVTKVLETNDVHAPFDVTFLLNVPLFFSEISTAMIERKNKDI